MRVTIALLISCFWGIICQGNDEINNYQQLPLSSDSDCLRSAETAPATNVCRTILSYEDAFLRSETFARSNAVAALEFILQKYPEWGSHNSMLFLRADLARTLLHLGHQQAGTKILQELPSRLSATTRLEYVLSRYISSLRMHAGTITPDSREIRSLRNQLNDALQKEHDSFLLERLARAGHELVLISDKLKLYAELLKSAEFCFSAYSRANQTKLSGHCYAVIFASKDLPDSVRSDAARDFNARACTVDTPDLCEAYKFLFERYITE